MAKTHPFEEEYEKDLILRAQRKDQAAFNELMSGHYDFCWNVAKRYCDYDSDIEEVVQEVLMKVWTKLDTFQFNSRFSTWLFRVTANHAIKNLTDRRRIPTHPHNQKVSYEIGKGQPDIGDDDVETGFHQTDTDSYHQFGINHESPESLIEADELAEIIFDQSNKLSDDLKEALYMREVLLMSYEDLAEALDCPVGTIKSRLFNARGKLDERLKRVLGVEDSSERFQIT